MMKKGLTLLLTVGFCFTLFSQKKLIPYREGKLWGLCDTNAIVKVKPMFDGIDMHSLNGHHLIHKDNKMGVITMDSMVLKPNYFRLFFIDTLFLLALSNDSKCKTVIDYKGNEIWTGDFKRINRHNVNFKIPLYSILSSNADSITILAFDSSKRRLHPIIKYKQIRRMGDEINNEHENFPLFYVNDSIVKFYYNEETGRLETLISVYEPNKTEIKVRSIDTAHRFVDIVNLNYNYKTSEIERQVNHYEYGLECETKEKTERFILPSGIDKIYELSYNYDLIPFHSIKNKDTLIKFQSYFVYEQNNKLGIFADRTVIPAQFDTLGQNFIVKDKGFMFMTGIKKKSQLKWGVINQNGEIIVENDFDSIHLWMLYYDDLAYIKSPQCYSNPQRYVQGFIAFKGKSQFIYDTEGNQLLNSKSAIVKEGRVNLNIIDGKKYGFFKDIDEYCQPTLPYPVYNFTYYEGSLLLFLQDNDNNFKGYANINGLLYFKD